MKGKSKMARLDVSQYEMAFKLLVSPNAAGKIIGNAGANIAELRQAFGIGCHIHGRDNAFPGTAEQVAVLLGSREQLDQAFEYVLQKILEADGGELQPGQPIQVVVVLSREAVSKVIGTKGATISSLRQETGCNFVADKEQVMGEQLVRVSGAVESLAFALAKLTPFVEESADSLQLAMQEYGSGVAAYGPSWDGVNGKGGGKKGPYGKAGADAWGPPAAKGGGKKGGGGGGVWPMASSSGKGSGVITPVPRQQPLPAGPRNIVPAAKGEPAGEPDTFAQPDEEDPNVLESQASIAFNIPADSVSRVLGKKGASSSMIRQQTNTALQIDPAAPGSTEALVTLSGRLVDVHRAHRMVIGRVLATY